jgi:hypothetical protein
MVKRVLIFTKPSSEFVSRSISLPY